MPRSARREGAVAVPTASGHAVDEASAYARSSITAYSRVFSVPKTEVLPGAAVAVSPSDRLPTAGVGVGGTEGQVSNILQRTGYVEGVQACRP